MIDLFQATDQTLGAAATYPSAFQIEHFPADGLLGMGFESISSYGASPVFQTLVSQGQVSDPVFSFYLAKSDSELFIGGANEGRYTGSFTYMSVTTQVGKHDVAFDSLLTTIILQGFWQGEFDGISVNGSTVIGSESAIIDTGNSLVVGSPESVQAVYAAIPGSNNAGNGIWTCMFMSSNPAD